MITKERDKEMMKQNAPSHVVEYCCIDKKDLFFRNLCDMYQDVNSFVYKLKCTCDCDKFIVYQDEHPSVFAKCNYCEKMITVYDLKYYPSAVKLNKDYTLKKLYEHAVLVYMNYEYDDEFMFEEDIEFDTEDITWGKVFVLNDNQLIKILDDETA